MFTGIVEELGTVVGRRGGRIRIAATKVLDGAAMGDSIAVNGCCLTVVKLGAGLVDSRLGTGPGRHSDEPSGEEPCGSAWEADVSEETLARTTLGHLAAGDPVNLERPVRLADRLGGHLVQGHVDGIGEVTAPVPDLAVRMPAELVRYVVEKGSITVDGVSLTVVEPRPDGFTVAVIPHTAEVTTLGHRRPGQRVNLEVDVIAKYTERLLRAEAAT